MAIGNPTTSDELNALRGKVVLITGGASGLGRDVATRAAERGAKLVLLDVRSDRLAAMAAALGVVDAPCLTVQCDVSKESDVVAAVGAAVGRFGQVDVVVNSAGVYRGDLLVDTPAADY